MGPAAFRFQIEVKNGELGKRKVAVRPPGMDLMDVSADQNGLDLRH
jgi:hypothetical protein